MFISHFNKMIRSRLLWLIFAIFVGGTFLAVPSCFQKNTSSVVVGAVGKTNITQDEYNITRLIVSKLNQNQNMTPAATETQVWATISAIVAAKNLGIEVSKQEMQSIIMSEPAFQINGVFSAQAYQQVIKNNLDMTIANYEKMLSYQLTFDKLRAAITAGSVASKMEVQDLLATRADNFTFVYATIPAPDTAALVATDDEIQAFYDEHKSDFALADRVAVEYAKVAASNYLDKVEISDEDIEDYYEANISAYTHEDGTNGVVTTDIAEVRDEILKTLSLEEARDTANREISDFIEELDNDSTKTFAEICKDKGYEVGVLPLFDANAHLHEIEESAIEEFKQSAFDLDSQDKDIANRIATANGEEYVYIILATANEEARDQTLDEIKETITPLALQEKVTKTIKENADAIQAKLAVAKTQEEFAEKAKELNLTISDSITFSPATAQEASFDQAAMGVAFKATTLATGKVSEATTISDGANSYGVAFLVSREEKPLTDADMMQQYTSFMGNMYDGEAWQEWLIWNMNELGVEANSLKNAATTAATNAEDDE